MPGSNPASSGVGKSLFLIVSQLVIAPMAVAIIAMPCVLAVLQALERATVEVPLIEGTVAYGLIIIVGFLIGLASCRAWDSLYATGAHLWILPAGLYTIITAGAFASQPPSDVVKTLFKISSHEGLGVVFFAFPTVAICSYSLGMVAARRWSKATA